MEIKMQKKELRITIGCQRSEFSIGTCSSGSRGCCLNILVEGFN
jgi:hypothetical protein